MESIRGEPGLSWLAWNCCRHRFHWSRKTKEIAVRPLISQYLTTPIGYPLIGFKDHVETRRRKQILNKFKFSRSTTSLLLLFHFTFASKYGNRQLNKKSFLLFFRFMCQPAIQQFERGVTSSGSNCTASALQSRALRENIDNMCSGPLFVTLNYLFHQF